MRLSEWFERYGLASLFGVVRTSHLDRERERSRDNQLIEELQERILELKTHNEDLEDENDTLTGQNERLRETNESLTEFNRLLEETNGQLSTILSEGAGNYGLDNNSQEPRPLIRSGSRILEDMQATYTQELAERDERERDRNDRAEALSFRPDNEIQISPSALSRVVEGLES